MSSDLPPSPPPAPQGENPALRARVPDHVAGGTFTTGAIVMTGPTEFIVDFLQTIGRPHRIACRVIIPHAVMPQFIDALHKNIELYRNRFGDLPVPSPQPQDPNARRPTPQEIYDDLKMPDDIMSGTYANGVMIGHGATEFGLDFLTSFFPQSAVSARVFLAAGQVPRLLESLKGAVQQLEQRRLGINPGKGHDDPVGPSNPSNPDQGPPPPEPKDPEPPNAPGTDE